ncbi:hypothetical protein HC024_00200 [Methylococcaceae bacterium WWC4]|nr:hypothetical protein [Methylococcaceae bacterium WWC4]
MFKLKSLFLSEAGEGGAGSGGAAAATAPTAAEIQAQIDAGVQAGITKFQTDFSAEFEKTTGHKDLKGFAEAQLAAQGKLQELADARGKESEGWKSRYEAAAISTAILGAAADAVDPSTVKDLLTGKAQVDDAGNVTIDGKPVADAVKALLEAKPFLAKAQGGTGSGAPANGNNLQTKTRAQFAALSPAEQADFCKAGGKVTE